MQTPEQFYTGLMVDVMGVTAREKKPWMRNPHSNDKPFHDTLADALITTGHEPLVELLLGKKSGDHNLAEALDAYAERKEFHRMVELLRQYDKYDKKRIHILFYLRLIDRMIECEATDETIFRFAEHLAHDDTYATALLDPLRKAGRHELARRIVENFIPEEEKPLERLYGRLLQNQPIEPQELQTVLEPYIASGDKRERMGGWEKQRRKTANIAKVLTTLSKNASIELIRIAYSVYLEGLRSEKIDYLDTEARNKIIRHHLENGEFKEAETFCVITGEKWRYDNVLRAEMSHAIRSKDPEMHRKTMESYLGKIEQALTDLENERETSPWRKRIEHLGLMAKKAAEQAIFELAHGSQEQGQTHIQEMMGWIDKIAAPPEQEDCPAHHKKTLRRHRRFYKHEIKERFQECGLFDQLPRTEGWNAPIMDPETRVAHRTKKTLQIEEEEVETHHQEIKMQRIQTALQEGRERNVEEAMLILEAQKSGYASIHDWEAGVLILKTDPEEARFKAIFELLSEGYFNPHSFREMDEFDHDGLVRFCLEGEKLGIFGEEEWQNLFQQWRRTCHMPDGQRHMTRKGVTTLIKGLLEQETPERAQRWFRQLQNSELLDRRTVMECLHAMIMYAEAHMDSSQCGAGVALKGHPLPSDAESEQMIAFLNMQIEYMQAASSPDRQDALGAKRNELLAQLKTPGAIRTWTRLMAMGSLRSPIEKKGELMAAYEQAADNPKNRRRIALAMSEHHIPGAEAMAEVKSKNTPPRVALLLFRKLVDNGFLHEYTRQYLTEEHLPYLRRLLSEHQNQFNTVMETLEKQRGPQEGLEAKDWQGILVVLRELGFITPGIYAEAKGKHFDPKALAEIGTRLRALKKNLFSNAPLDPTINPALVAELIWAAYQPVNMSLSNVEFLLSQIRDSTSHLERYRFPAEGYPLDLTHNKTMHLRTGKTLQTPQDIYKYLYLPLQTNEAEAKKQHAQGQVRRLCKAGRLKLQDFRFSDVLEVFKNDEVLREALRENQAMSQSEDEQYRALCLLQEFFGIYMTDNLEATIREFLARRHEHTSEMIHNFVEGFKNPGRKQAIQQQLGTEIKEEKSDLEIAAHIIAQAILKKFQPLAALQQIIADDLKNFVAEGEEESEEAIPTKRLRAVISKNKASFFAKASAGICTSHDTVLFHREDHFHINLLDDAEERCVGNVQAYIMPHQSRSYLLLRGLNPSTRLLKEIDAGSITEAVIAIGKQFAAVNGLDGVMLSEQGSFLALSNRPEVTAYIQKTYKRKIVTIDEFNITQAAKITSAYLVENTANESFSPAKPENFHDSGYSQAA